MDWQFLVGIGAAVLFGLLPFAVKDMPAWITWPGIAAGAVLILWGLVPQHERVPTWAGLLFVAFVGGAIGSGIVIASSLRGSTETALQILYENKPPYNERIPIYDPGSHKNTGDLTDIFVPPYRK